MKKIKLFLSLALSTALLTTHFSIPTHAFDDTTGHWAESYIQQVVAKGYMKGGEDGNFYPNKELTFGELAVVIVQAAYGGNYLKTDEDAHWSDIWLNVLHREKLFFTSTGYDITSELENYQTQGISRANVSTIAARLMSKGSGFTTGSSSLKENYTDLPSNALIIHDQIQDIYDVIDNAIMEGSDQQFFPDSSLTRGEAAVLFLKLDSQGVFDFKKVASSSSGSGSSSTGGTSNSGNSNVATTNSVTFRTVTDLMEQFDWHGSNLGYTSSLDYLSGANKVVLNPQSLQLSQGSGATAYFLESTDEFVLVSSDGFLLTYFIPDNGILYFFQQAV